MGSSSTTINNSSPNTVSGVDLSTSAYGLPLPVLYGTNRLSANLIWYDGFRVVATTSKQSGGGKGGGGTTIKNTSYTYFASYQFALCEGEVNSVLRSWVDDTLYTGNQTVMNGSVSQSAWSYQAVTNPAFADAALAYRGTAVVCRDDAQLGGSGNMQAMTFEVRGIAVSTHGDAWPPHILTDLLSNARYGAEFPGGSLGDLNAWGNYCHAFDLYLSPLIKEQTEARTLIKSLCEMTNAAPIWSDGFLKIIPCGDEPVTGNGHTYAPDVTPVYHLTDDDFLQDTGSDGPLKVRRKRAADAHNDLSMTWQDREQDYADATTSLQDLAHIEQYGLRPGSSLQSFGVTRANVAATVVQTALQRELYICAEYEFRLPWRFCRLEPMDRVTLTDAALGLNQVHVRIKEIEEGEDGLLSVVAEDAPLGVSTPGGVVGVSGSAGGLALDVDPGDVADPVAFEPPGRLVTTDLAVWVAVTGMSASWGGAHVWASLDGAEYQHMGTAVGGARYGTLTAAVDADAGSIAHVLLAGNGGQLIAASTASAEALSTLCLVGDEYAAYTAATLTAVNAYNLTLAVRGAMGSTAVAHASSQRFVRVDERIVKSDALDPSMVGKTIKLKFTSFNIYGRATQELADVAEYEYEIGGDHIESASEAIVRKPVQISPPDGAIVASSSIYLAAAAYSSRPMGIDYHYASQWQVATDVGFATLVFDSGEDTVNLSSLLTTVAQATGATYYWRVRYRGEVLEWSEWSAARSFVKSAGIVGVYTEIAVSGGPGARIGPSMASIGDDIYVFGGNGGIAYRELWRFDTLAVVWSQCTPLPVAGLAASTRGCSQQMVALGGYLWVSAGGNVYRYDPAEDAWSSRAAFSYLSLSTDGTFIYGVSPASTAWQKYDPATNAVATAGGQIGDVNRGGNGYGSYTGLLGKVYAFGGTSNASSWVCLNILREYDPATAAWSEKASGPSARRASVGADVGGVLYEFGGNTSNYSGQTNTAVVGQLWSFDPLVNTWAQIPGGVIPARMLAGMCSCRSALWVFGGSNSSGVALGDLWRIT